jgi:hypothetical protein
MPKAPRDPEWDRVKLAAKELLRLLDRHNVPAIVRNARGRMMHNKSARRLLESEDIQIVDIPLEHAEALHGLVLRGR